MHFLVFDTSSESAFVALACLEGDLEIVYFEELPFGYHHSKNLFPAIERALQSRDLKVEALKFIAVGVGPGSYTGIRVAAAAAQSLSYGGGEIPVVGVCSLKGFASDRECRFASLIDARSGGVYFLEGVHAAGEVKFIGEAELVANEQIDARLEGIECVASPSLKILREKIELDSLEFLERSIDPKLFAREALAIFEKGGTFSADQLELLYLRKTQAEIEQAKK